MIKELVQFTKSLDSEIKAIGAKPKDGMHIMLHFQNDGEIHIAEDFQYEVFSQKKSELTPFLRKAASLAKMSWMVNTNKCFDLPAKGIHSCSPYCLAFKRESIQGGAKFSDAKTKLYERVNSYFSKALELIEDEAEREKIKVFRDALNSENKLHFYLDQIPEYKSLKDAEYIVFYLGAEEEKYFKPNAKYLADKLFNTNDFNHSIDEIIYGTSDFFNGYPTKKPYLTHQSASFNIASRISASEARSLFDFQDIMRRNILPKPLPIFIHQDEIIQKKKRSLQESSIQLFKSAAQDNKRIGYKEIIENLYQDYGDELGNYYLLFYDRDVIKDFDFVPKFEYLLKNANDDSWKIEDLFGGKNNTTIKNVFQLQQAVLQPVFNNFLVTQTKSVGYQYKYFDELDAKYAKSAATYLLTIQFRKAFYDFIYKSKRQSVTQLMFDTILQASIVEDIRLDEIKNGYHTQDGPIRRKMNIWFSLSEQFITSHIKSTNTTMSSKLQELRTFIVQLAKTESNISSDEQYAFAVGQVIYYLLSKSKTADRSYKRLEPFMQQVQAKELNKAIARMFDSYKHENFSFNFKNPFAEVMAYDTKTSIRDLTPLMLAGIFSRNALFSNKEEEEEKEIILNEENTEE
jgi:CRISPR-associated protein Csh1